jgi:hypothetical protein
MSYGRAQARSLSHPRRCGRWTRPPINGFRQTIRRLRAAPQLQNEQNEQQAEINSEQQTEEQNEEAQPQVLLGGSGAVLLGARVLAATRSDLIGSDIEDIKNCELDELTEQATAVTVGG